MRKTSPLILTAVIFISTALLAHGTDIRGQVEGYKSSSGTIGPLAGIRVSLFFVTPPHGFQLVRDVVSGPDGLYYFSGIHPGNYILQINGMNYPLSVSDMPFQDIPPIRL
jgi:hypothetical protein